ncbi:TRAP transporter small permease [Jannaschia sp. LMIT008]|uniref:TRAP transporter small permease n=1 Tax=Jannaschia maritima TaxID=3032585 RepID=UPI002810FDAE|nr:TRAP transporter small permease [Jannaschia sp. LMIT008]
MPDHRWTFLDPLARVVVAISAVSLVALVVLTGWQVWGRYVLNDTPTWTEKAALLLILVVTLPMAAVGLRENTHLGLDLLVDALPRPARRAVRMLGALAVGVFGVWMIFGSWPLVERTWGRLIPLLPLPQGVQYLPLMITGALIAIFMAERIWMLARGWEPLPDLGPPADPGPEGRVD